MSSNNHVKRLVVRHIKGVRNIEINDPGECVTVAGKNYQGKSSLIESIILAMGGKAAHGKKPLRDGEADGDILLETDELIITRSFKDDDTTILKAKRREGGTYKQGDLDKMFNSLFADPIAFADLNDKEQVKIVKSLFTAEDNQAIFALDEEILQLEKQRTFVGQKSGEMGDVEVPEAVEAVDIKDIMELFNASIAKDSSRRVLIQEGTELKERNDKIERDVAELIRQAKELKEERESNLKKMATLRDQLKEVGPSKTAEYQNQLDDLGPSIKKAEAYKEAMEKKNKKDELALDYTKKTGMIKSLRKERDETVALASKNIAAKGISVRDGAVWFKEIPFQELSSTEKMVVSTQLSISSNPIMKVLLIRSGERLDDDNLKRIKAIAKKHGFQVWIERVGEEDDCIIIEDGSIKEDRRNK